MKKALVLDSNDIKNIVAEKFNVAEESVIKSQYSYTVIIENDNDDEERSE